MKFTSLIRFFGILLLSLFTSISFAGGRYADPPPNLVEVHKASTEALQAAKAGNKDAALSAATQARKLCIDSYKTKSTMPMQGSSGRLKHAIAALEGDKTDEAVKPLEETVNLLQEELTFYKDKL
jgi:hypothetical protein